MQEAEDRGWDSVEKFVCAGCVENDFLRKKIEEHATSRSCGYCGTRRRSNFAAPVDIILEYIGTAMYHSFGEPSSAGVPYDGREGGYQAHTFDTCEALMALGLVDVHDSLFKDIENSFNNAMWVDAPGGSWMGSSYDEHLLDSWHTFSTTVKHVSRYFFTNPTSDDLIDLYQRPTFDILTELAVIAKETLLRNIPENAALYRVREWPDPNKKPNWEPTPDEMGAPPDEDSTAGRMNPAGISYLYLAFEQNTAIAEIVKEVPRTIAIATFKAVKDLTVLDLCNLPTIPSIFDSNRTRERETAIFLMHFTRAISRPVDKDGREHIDYVPTQVVCEYFRQVFDLGSDQEPRRLDGIVYPSAELQMGKNAVLFPSPFRTKSKFPQVVFETAQREEIQAQIEPRFKIDFA